jgi:hypothetical protein
MYVRTEVPASPKILRIRTDVSWQDVVASSADESRFINRMYTAKQNIKIKEVKSNVIDIEQLQEAASRGEASYENTTNATDDKVLGVENRSEFFENSGRGSSTRAKKYNTPSVWNSLENRPAFHEKFAPKNSTHVKKYDTPSVWGSVEHRRAFFEKYAKQNRFDPRVPSNWYNLTKITLLREPVCSSSLSPSLSPSPPPPSPPPLPPLFPSPPSFPIPLR